MRLCKSLIGGFTFIMASMMAIAQNDGKKVLAFSTISNLGLIVACAGTGVEETVWGAVFLMIFHSVSKSMLFQAVGATENCLGSRDIEDMHGMLLRLPKLTYIMGIGIAGMYLAPFGMLISKWVALKAFVDSGKVVLVGSSSVSPVMEKLREAYILAFGKAGRRLPPPAEALISVN